MNLQDFLFAVLKPGDVCLDVGAHVGNIAAAMAARVGPHGRVFAVEAHPQRFQDLSRQAESFPVIQPVHRAMSDKKGKITLFSGTQAFCDQASTIATDFATPERLGADIQQIEVEATTVDAFCQENAVSPDFIKVDVEGAETIVFAGAAGTLSSKPLVVFEMGTDAARQSHVEMLQNLGYRFFVLEIDQYPTQPGAGHRTTDNRHLQGSIFSFEWDEISGLGLSLFNVIAYDPARHGERLAQINVMPLRTAAPLMTDPDANLMGRAMRTVASRLVPRAFKTHMPGLYRVIRKVARAIS